MPDTYADPNQGFPNPKIHEDLVDPDQQAQEQAEASVAAGPGPGPDPRTGAGTSVPSRPADEEPQ